MIINKKVNKFTFLLNSCQGFDKFHFMMNSIGKLFSFVFHNVITIFYKNHKTFREVLIRRFSGITSYMNIRVEFALFFIIEASKQLLVFFTKPVACLHCVTTVCMAVFMKESVFYGFTIRHIINRFDKIFYCTTNPIRVY